MSENCQKIEGGYGLVTRNPLSFWSGRPDSNRRRPAWEAGILPLNYGRVSAALIIPPTPDRGAAALGREWTRDTRAPARALSPAPDAGLPVQVPAVGPPPDRGRGRTPSSRPRPGAAPERPAPRFPQATRTSGRARGQPGATRQAARRRSRPPRRRAPAATGRARRRPGRERTGS